MFNRTTATKYFAPSLSRAKPKGRQACPEPFLCQDKLRRRDRKDKYFPVSPNLASLLRQRTDQPQAEPLQLAPWNTDSTKVELFARSAIPQGSPSGVLISTQPEYDPQGVLQGGSHRLSDFLNPNSTEVFIYVWLDIYPPSQKSTGVNPWMNARRLSSVTLAKEDTLWRVAPDEVCGRCHWHMPMGLHDLP